MDPTLNKEQESQRKKSDQGLLSKGINSINLARNPFGKIRVLGVVTQAARSGFAVLLTSPTGLPILIALATIVIFTAFIVGFGGIPSLETNSQSVINPNPTPLPPAEP